MSADAQVTATFNALPPPPPPTTVALTVMVTGPGNVTSTPAGLDCGTDTSCTASFGVGAQLTLTAVPASGAQFRGWAGACSGASTCTLKLSAPAQASAAFETAMVTLVATNTGGSIALNSTNVFYSSGVQIIQPQVTIDEYVIRAVPKSGGAARDVAVSHDYVIAMRANDAYVYWAAGDTVHGGVYRAPVQGGVTETLFVGQRLSDIALDDSNVYFANFPGLGAGSGAVYAIPIAGGPHVVLQSGVTPWGGLTADSTDVYFADNPPQSAYIKRVPKTGGTATTVVSCADSSYCGFPVLRADSQSIYYLDGEGGGVFAWHKSDASTVTVAPPADGARDLDVNASIVFWTIDWNSPQYNPNPSPAPGLKRTIADGSVSRYLDSASPPILGWASPRADDSYVFYLRSGALVRHVK